MVVGGSRSATGRPLLANDPHGRSNCPRCATWRTCRRPALTSSAPANPRCRASRSATTGTSRSGSRSSRSTRGLYVYRTNPDAPDEYRYADRGSPCGWCVSRSRSPAGAPVEVSYGSPGTARIYADPERHTAFAVRAAGWSGHGAVPGQHGLHAGALHRRVRRRDEPVGTPGRTRSTPRRTAPFGWRRPGWCRSDRTGTHAARSRDGRYEWAGSTTSTSFRRCTTRRRLGGHGQRDEPARDYPHRERTVTYDWYTAAATTGSPSARDARGFTVEDCCGCRATRSTCGPAGAGRAGRVHPGRAVAEAVALLRAWTVPSPPIGRRRAVPGGFHATCACAAAARASPSWSSRARGARVLRLLPDELASADVRADLAYSTRCSPRRGPTAAPWTPC